MRKIPSVGPGIAIAAMAAAAFAQGCNLFQGFGSFSSSATPTPAATGAPRGPADKGTERERTGSVDIRSARSAAAAAAAASPDTPGPLDKGSHMPEPSVNDAPSPTATVPVGEAPVP